MKGVSTILLFVSSLSMLLITVFLINQLKMERTFEEKSMFECGFNGKMSMTHSFSINYFYITIIFLMFDLEVLIIAPLALFYSNIWETMLVTALTTYFTLILAMEWMNSMLQWQKWH